MSSSAQKKRTFVGFGFGAIQAGLFLYEAMQSQNFDRLVIAEVLPDVVASVRTAGGFFGLNIADTDLIQHLELGPIHIENPAEPEDRLRLIEAIAEAGEIATAIPSVNFYVSTGPGSLHRVLAAGLRQKTRRGGPRAVIYAAENNNHAAEILKEAVLSQIPPAERDKVRQQVQFLNTVIGKMSGVKTDAGEIDSLHLTPMTPDSRRAFLVEAFNHILITQIEFDARPHLSPYRRGIEVFAEKPDLLPFEEAKLYGHNAVHALAAYLGAMHRRQFIADLRQDAAAMAFLRDAFIEEAGQALVRKYAGSDPLFTPEGFGAYAEDLLERMTNPLLRDSIARVGRDPARKLGWNDRLVGTMRLALRQGITPCRFAVGTAAALATLDPSTLRHGERGHQVLANLWQEAAPAPAEAAQVWRHIDAGRDMLCQWQRTGEWFKKSRNSFSPSVCAEQHASRPTG
ncbi:MAG: hypothetical protein GXP37_11535 [Chloroflexi bacterium]|nr:hypothetical protein [Chloroflexota bacterium]